MLYEMRRAAEAFAENAQAARELAIQEADFRTISVAYQNCANKWADALEALERAEALAQEAMRYRNALMDHGQLYRDLMNAIWDPMTGRPRPRMPRDRSEAVVARVKKALRA